MTWYRKRPRVTVSFDDEKMLTRQAFAEETNVNQIMAKYQATGQITHINHHPGMYGDFSKINSLQEAMNQIDAARDIFLNMPAEVRQQFGQDLSKFIEFSQTASAEQLLEKGIIVEEPQQRVMAQTSEAVPPAEKPKEAPPEQPPS